MYHRVVAFGKGIDIASMRPWFAARGMADMRISDDFKKCVIFIGIKDGDSFAPKGTAFVVSIFYEQFQFQYLVTAEHIVSGIIASGQDVWIRINLKDGKVVEERIPYEGWHYHPDAEFGGHDVAVVSYTILEKEDVLAIPVLGTNAMSATAEIMKSHDLGAGEEIFVVGLFRSHHGQQRNIPLVRVGSIASMRDEPIQTKYCGYLDGYLAEVHSVGGLSGSPVFVQTGQIQMLVPQPFVPKKRFYILGLMHGHFDIADLTTDTAVDDAEGRAESINTGVGVVIPIEQVIETINHPGLDSQRQQAIRQHREKIGATVDAKTTVSS